MHEIVTSRGRQAIASARLEKDIFVKTHLHTSPIVVKIMTGNITIESIHISFRMFLFHLTIP